jgi:hypothetical protein
VFMCVTALSDVLTLNFFLLVRDEGSWLEIRTGVSPFRIGGALGVFLAASEGLGGWWGRGVVWILSFHDSIQTSAEDADI